MQSVVLNLDSFLYFLFSRPVFDSSVWNLYGLAYMSTKRIEINENPKFLSHICARLKLFSIHRFRLILLISFTSRLTVRGFQKAKN
jgi:hypothetical protein